MTNQQDTWPAGATWVFQGTVAEDATGGTHVPSLTVTPGAGNEMQILYGGVVEGNTATAQAVTIFTDDGTNLLSTFVFVTDTAANVKRFFPSLSAPTANTNQFQGSVFQSNAIISGTSRFVIQVSTTAISVTQAFSLVCRIKGAMPTAVLADPVGAPVLTVNTNKVF